MAEDVCPLVRNDKTSFRMLTRRHFKMKGKGLFLIIIIALFLHFIFHQMLTFVISHKVSDTNIFVILLIQKIHFSLFILEEIA